MVNPTIDDCVPGLTYWKDIRPLFTTDDIAAMKSPKLDLHGIRLDDPTVVVQKAEIIYDAVKSGYMPCAESGRRWSADMVSTFGCWILQGKLIGEAPPNS